MSGAFAGERVVVIGAGVAGAAAAAALTAEGADVFVTETRPAGDVDAAAIAATGARLGSGGHLPEHLDGADLVVVSPGVPPSAEVIGWARARGLPLWGEMELGARLVRAPYLAVTGTNGKTTTTGMLTAMCRAAGLDAVACGNIGYPFTTAALETHDVLVVEVSSFQLELQTSFRPAVSVLLNVAPDHLDAHGSFDAYVAAKARIVATASPQDLHVGNADDPVAAGISASAPCRVRWFRSGPPGEDEVGFEDDELVSRIGAPARLGTMAGRSAGYRSDAAAAAAAAIGYGVPAEAVHRGLGDHRPAPHRGEVVAEIAGVRFIDDSKATNVHAALAALAGLRHAVLIAGGRSKGQDLSPLVGAADHLDAVVAIGEAAAELEAAFDGIVPVTSSGSIEDAVRRAFELASRGGTVVLAPACASWDQFRDYAERGDRFADAARGLAVAHG
jgi:UDP-N-acetylmuramoylalanine--D-glutamate ligase